MHHKIRFIRAGQVEEIDNCNPTQTVLEYLREEKGLTGTKEGCAEGDCGACTVVVGELYSDGIRYRAVNSCIQFLATLDGRQLITVEDLATPESGLHPVQQAMVDQHGSQCGFCTPGFVMSLFAMFHHERESAVKAVDIDLELAGNLCRCTGYAPIVRAAEQALTPGRSDLLSDNITQQLRQLKAIQPINSLETGAGDRLFFTPRTLDELCTTLQKHPRATLVAGATDVGLWVTKQMRRLDSIIYLGGVGELGRIRDDGHGLELGAAVSYTDAIEPISKYYPAFRSLMERIGAKQVRNVGTVGGNIANGSPIGDMPPGLIAAGARLTLCSKAGRRVMDLEDFFIRYGVQDLQQGEFVECLYLPAPEPDQVFATYKISKRIEQDISAVCAAFALKIKGGRIKDARVCFGGMAEIPKRASHCERSLEGRTWNQQSIEMAMTALADDFTPINDMRASRTYRMRVAQNLLQRFYLEQLDLQYPVRLTSKFGQAVSDG